MNGKLFHVTVHHGQYDGSSEPDTRTVAICTHGVHVKYTMETLFARSNDLLFATMGKIECSTCDGSCRQRYDMRHGQPDDPKTVWRNHIAFLRQNHIFWAEPMQRQVSYTVYSDGDSGCSEFCHGHYHIISTCHEFGMGWDDVEVKACDCDQRTDVILPEAIAKRVKKFLSARAKQKAGPTLYPSSDHQVAKLASLNFFLSSISVCLGLSPAFSVFLGMPAEVIMSTHVRFVGFADEQVRKLAIRLFAGPEGLKETCSKISAGYELDIIQTHFPKGSWILHYPCCVGSGDSHMATLTRSRGQVLLPFQKQVWYVGQGYLLLDACNVPIKGSFHRVRITP